MENEAIKENEVENFEPSIVFPIPCNVNLQYIQYKYDVYAYLIGKRGGNRG
jgi:hypothetical protein